jgi:transposase InsO family protein
MAPFLSPAESTQHTSSGLVYHWDTGVQYTSLSFGERLEDEDLLPSMGRVGSAYARDDVMRGLLFCRVHGGLLQHQKEALSSLGRISALRRSRRLNR